MYDNDDYESLEEIMSEKSDKKKKSKHNKLIDKVREIEEFTYDNMAPTPKSSSAIGTFLYDLPEKSEKEFNEEIQSDGYDPDEWFNELVYGHTKIGKSNSKKITDDLFVFDKKKKKKKKNGKAGELIDYKKEFEPEMTLYKNLLTAQNKFTDSLQKEYDNIKSVKSSSRGVSKQMSDLVENITQARSLSMQLVDKHVNAKKLIADLSLKQKKEFGALVGEGENMADFASSYLKQMLNERQSILDPTGESVVADYSDDEMLDEISSVFDEDDDRPEEVDQYLKYENKNVEIFVVITDNDIENYRFIAKDDEGNEIFDYPMPNHTPISVNWSTGIATDTYGKKYNIIQY